MSNTWKAVCIKSNCTIWTKGDTVSVVDGVIVESSRDYIIGVKNNDVSSFKEWVNSRDRSKWKLVKEVTQPDAINPSHYKECSLECIDAMLMAFGADHVYMYCCITAWKYMWRYKNKNGIEDIKKARWYIEKAKELGHDQPEVWNLEYVLEKIEKVKGIPLC